MAITALDGSQRQPLPGVRDGSFSPDGAKLAYSLIDGGILIRDRPRVKTFRCPAPPTSTPSGRRTARRVSSTAAWASSISSSSTWMARTCARSPTAGCRVAGGLAGGWQFPLHRAGPGVRVHRLPPRPRQRRKPGVLEREHQSLSPDGQYVAIARLAFGERWQIDISRLDGADRWALANDSLWVLNPLWSASGEWLLATVSATDSGSTTGALINLRTCGSSPCRTSKATSSTGSRKVPLLSRGWGSGGRFAPTAISALVGSVI